VFLNRWPKIMDVRLAHNQLTGQVPSAWSAIGSSATLNSKLQLDVSDNMLLVS
jgi:hypothetical protein